MASGKAVADTTPAEKPSDATMEGRYITLEKLSEKHLSDVWHHYNIDDSTWKWLPDGKPKDKEEFETGFKDVMKENVLFAVMADPKRLGPGPEKQSAGSGAKREALGFVAYGGDFNTKHRTVEAGAIFGPVIRRSVASTETHYLLLRNIFEPPQGPGYRRVSWKTNSLNLASQRAAERIGYVHEGIWRNHMIDRGQSRDSAWLAVVDDDWPIIKAALEEWLDPKNFDESGKQIKRLEDIRQSLK